MKNLLLAITLIAFSVAAYSQGQSDDSKSSSGFKKENLFAGGSLNLGFGNYYTNLGISPYFGISLNKYVDVAGTFGVNYFSQKNFDNYDNVVSTERLTLYGPGAFVRVFPLKFLFVQGQYEFNFIDYKRIPVNGALVNKLNHDANSFLLGGGIASARNVNQRSYFYFSVLWDIAHDPNSPYLDIYDRPLPILKAGINIALFQQNQNQKNKHNKKSKRSPERYYRWHGRRW